jgi:hypothetical protein
MRLAALLLLMPLGVIFTGLMWFASLWIRHQDDHVPEPKEEFWNFKEACK